MILLDYDFGSGNHVTIFPKHMKPSTLQKEYIRAYRQFNNLSRTLESLRQGNLQAGVERLFATLAHRSIIADIEKRYLPRLYAIEQDYYDANEKLIEERLPPGGVIGADAILPPESETSYDPTLQGDWDVVNLLSDDGLHAPVPSGQTLDVDAVQGMVRNHTLEMALRKCYGNTFS